VEPLDDKSLRMCEIKYVAYLDHFHYQIVGPSNTATGATPKLVFLHGVMGFGANWRTVTRAFEADYQILTFDQRGHGRSFHPADGYSAENYANDLELILDELGWDEITLVGHSMGGRNALEFAWEHPHRVTRLVIVDIGPAIDPEGADLLLKLIGSVPVPFPNKRAAREFFDTRFQEIYADRPSRLQLAEFLFVNITENAQGQAVWRFDEEGIRTSIQSGRQRERWDQVEALKMPTLWIRGERSRDLPQPIFAEILRRNPLIEGVEIKGAGHWVHSDRPQVFIQTLKEFLARHL
jgi:esterase